MFIRYEGDKVSRVIFLMLFEILKNFMIGQKKTVFEFGPDRMLNSSFPNYAVQSSLPAVIIFNIIPNMFCPPGADDDPL